MNILLGGVTIITLAGFRIRKEGEDNFMSPKNTKALKGLFVLLVILQHLSEYKPALNGLSSNIYNKFQFYFGQNIVALFLFLSGFGIASRILSGGGVYLRTFPQKRIAKVLIDFEVAVFLYLVMNILLRRHYPISKILLSCVGWEQIGNSNWYIFVTLVMYILIYVIFSIIRNQNLGILIFFGCNVLYIWLFHTFELRPDYFYNTALCFGAGMVFKLIYPYLFKVIQNSIVYASLLIGIPVLTYYLLRYNYIIWIFNLIAIFMAVWICLFNYRFKVDNPVLDFFGDRIFGIYILQRIPMTVLEAVGINVAYIYIPLCFGMVIIMEHIYAKLLNRIHNKMGI